MGVLVWLSLRLAQLGYIHVEGPVDGYRLPLDRPVAGVTVTPARCSHLTIPGSRSDGLFQARNKYGSKPAR